MKFFILPSGRAAILLMISVIGAVTNIAVPASAQNAVACSTDETFAVALHGGAVFSRGDHSFKTSFLEQLLAKSRAALVGGARAIDVVETTIADMENSGLFNAGKGAISNQTGVVEMDASIMEGQKLDAGSVASVKTIRNPISAARLVMDKSPYVMMVGPGAEGFVAGNNGEIVNANYFLHDEQNYENVPLPNDLLITPPGASVPANKAGFSGVWGAVVDNSYNHVLVVEEVGPVSASVISALGPHPYWGKGYFVRLPAVFVDDGMQITEPSDSGDFVSTYRLNPDGTLSAIGESVGVPPVRATLRRIPNPNADHNGGTVGAVVRDRCGDLAAGTSTGGFNSKMPGRVGDSPIIGAGTYANNETVAISATGHGEFFMRHVVAYAISAAMEYGGLTVEEATNAIIKGDLSRKGLRGGVIAVDPNGNISMSYNTKGMVRGSTTSSQPITVVVY